ncbi:sigma-70 family RNA polymerase sigma factor [Haliscomenobacter sp.]|uniref:RNA polymerase sigma factor n=1 Tax=Haliscomenobacter sp. TaxID=2717303 RepID=UPI00336514B5
MDRSTKTVSESAMQQEWEEIRAAQGNPALFRPLYERYYESVFRQIYRRTTDMELSGDLSSQVFLKALQKINTYTFQGVPFSAWLFRIAANEVSQHFRQQQSNRVVSVNDLQLHDLIDEIGSDPEEMEALRRKMLGALDNLKEDDMQLIEMRFFEQRSFKEIAEIQGITENNAKVKVHRILERLKRKLSGG